MSHKPPSETIETHGCRVALRRFRGPEAAELFLHAEPPPGVGAGEQAAALYAAVLGVLGTDGGDASSLAHEMLFLRSVDADLERVRAARSAALGDLRGGAITEIGQPPLNEESRLEISVQAVLPHAGPLRSEHVPASPACDCPECARCCGVRVSLGAETRLYAGGLYGGGADAAEQTRAMFHAAEQLLERAGMGFQDVVRTWIHLREMERDYAALNRARRAFFAERAIDPPPASTGIGGAPVPDGHDLCLAVQALQGSPAGARSAMSAHTLNEAPQYGSDFVRGMRVEDANKVALQVSGTASIDEIGRTAHPDDLGAQVERMLVNVAALLEGQGAGLADVVSAITYLKEPHDAARLRAKLRAAGFEGFPNALVTAEVCRPELLCETEVLAVLPRA